MAMESPSANSEDRPSATIIPAPVEDPSPDRAMLRVVMSPSRPP